MDSRGLNNTDLMTLEPFLLFILSFKTIILLEVLLIKSVLNHMYLIVQSIKVKFEVIK